MVKINIAYPPYNTNQMIEVDDEKKWRCFLDKRLNEEVPADTLGDEFKGYVFKITGAYDKQGFPCMQGVMLNHRVGILLDGRTGQYTPKRHGCRKRKSVRGCILGIDMSCINVAIIKRGPVDLPKLTEESAKRPNTRGPKRANKIRKAWGLGKKDDVRQYVVKRTIPGKNGKKDRVKSPKIQRLITPIVKQRRRKMERFEKKCREKSRKEAADYANLLKQIRAQKRAALLSKRRTENRSKLSEKLSTTKKTEGASTEKKAEETKKATTTTTTETKKATTTTTETKKAATATTATTKKGGVTKPANLAKKSEQTKTTTAKATTGESTKKAEPGKKAETTTKKAEPAKKAETTTKKAEPTTKKAEPTKTTTEPKSAEPAKTTTQEPKKPAEQTAKKATKTATKPGAAQKGGKK